MRTVELLRFGVSGHTWFATPLILAVASATMLTVSWLAAGAAFRRYANR